MTLTKPKTTTVEERIASPEMLRFIETKRNGGAHSTEDIYWLINNLDKIPDYQLSAWLMAVCMNGLTDDETTELTRAMAYSGHVLTLKREAPAAFAFAASASTSSKLRFSSHMVVRM